MGIFSKILVFIFIFSGCTYGQVSYYNFNVNNGLPSNEAYCVIQDKRGYIWVGTDHGVGRYDGHEFKSFTTENGLTDNTVFLLKEDDYGNIWCLTYSGGICYYDGKSFRPHPNNDTIKALCKHEVPTSWAVTGDNVIWLGFAGKNICKINDHETRIFDFTPSSNSHDSADFVILNIKKNEFVYTAIPPGSSLNITDSAVTSVQKFRLPLKLIGGLSKNFGLIRLPDGGVAISQWKGFVHIGPTGVRTALLYPTGKEITATKCLDGKSIWILVQNGTSYCVNTHDSHLVIIDSLALTNAATDIIIDRQGNHWVSTLNAGIFMIQNSNIKIFDFNKRGIDARAYSLKQFDGYLYVGLSQNSYFKIDNNLHGVFRQGKRYPSAIWSFAPYGKHEVITDVDLSVDLHDLLIFKDMLPIDSGKLLCGGTGGVVILDRSFKPIYISKNREFKQRVNRMARISSSRFILGTNTSLFYMDTHNGYRFTEENFFKNTRITSCKTLNDSVYAVATRGKGVFLNVNKRFYPINVSKGLKTNLDEDLYFENDSVLWIASYKGIAKVYFSLLADSLNLRIKCYTKEDGLCSDQVNAIAGYNGLIWLATNEGLCYFKPSDLREDICNIPIYFGNIYSNGNKLNSDSLELKYDEGNLLIEFHALYYKSVSGIRYKVRLKDRESWKYTSQSYVQYFNLPAGNYEFQVAAEDNFGKYYSPVIDLKFVIHPKFTNTIFFKFILVILALLIIAVILFQVFRYQRLKSANFINLLKAEFKALNYQINPHFIFNVLNSIQYYILRKESDKAVHFLNSFSLLIRRIVTNSRQQYISVIEEIECLKEYMDLEKLRLDNKFDYVINIDSRVDIEAKILVLMIIQPIVENSIWHGIVPSGFKGKVKIDFKLDDNALVIVVEDNGVGLRENGQNLNSSPQHLSMAMSNINERLKIIGDLNDSTWYIHMEDKKEKGLHETGAIVTIRFPEIKKS